MSLRIENDGAVIPATNFFSSEWAQRGLMYCSINRGAVRLLVPDSFPAEFFDAVRAPKAVSLGIADARAARRIRLLIVDGDPGDPYAVDLDARQCDRLLPASEIGRVVPLLVYGAGATPGSVRTVATTTVTIARAE